jgi:hypothetical protein
VTAGSLRRVIVYADHTWWYQRCFFCLGALVVSAPAPFEVSLVRAIIRQSTGAQHARGAVVG